LGKTGDLYRDRYWHEAHIQESHNLYSYFKARGKSLATASVAWVLKQSGITSAILGASKPEQLDDSLSSVKNPLNAEEMEVCNKAWFALPRPEKPPL
jgi:aryl-alcohol dehydrogenase-like predicted oxidoreductase